MNRYKQFFVGGLVGNSVGRLAGSLASVILTCVFLAVVVVAVMGQSDFFAANDGSAGSTDVAISILDASNTVPVSAATAIHSLQRGQGRGQRGWSRRQSQRSDYTNWEIEKEFNYDVFTFVRIQYDSLGGGFSGRTWANDFPDCDWNFSVRVHELTSMQVDPNGKVIRLTDQELFHHPFIFMTNINRMSLSDDEVTALRSYLLKGGFLMADDFWAPQAWRHVEREMKRVFPELKPRELPRDHEIFKIVYDVQGKLQVPSIRAWMRGAEFEYWHGDPEGDEDPHFWGYFDEEDRLMALMCHNNDIADGWEREGENEEYFKKYSERVSYPLGINIITYAMTH